MKTASVLSNFLSGVLDPRAAGRVESDAYNSALKTGINIEIGPLGGARRRRGSLYRATLPNVLSRVTSLTATAPNGGTANNAKDNDTTTSVTTTTPVGTTNPFVVVHYDLGSAQTVKFIDVLGIALTAGASVQFCLQYSLDNSAWVTVGTALEGIDTVARDYRREAGVSARYWRVARIGSTDLSTANVTLTDVNVWTETTTISAVKKFPFEVSSTAKYLVCFTDKSATIVENGVVVDQVPMPYGTADIVELCADSSEGEMVITHEDYPTRSLYEGGSSTFQGGPLTLTNVPEVDFDDDSSPTPVSDVQVITFTGFAAGNTFQISLEGARTGTIYFSGDANADQQEATAADIEREVQKLYTVNGFEGVTCARTGSNEYTVTFAGASAGDYELMSVAPLTGSANSGAVVKSASGTSRAEPVWSATRGYPRTVRFFEGRMYFGGSRSNPSSLFGSSVKTYYDFDVGQGLDSDAIFVTLSGQQTNVIQGLLAGRSLMIFTTGGEFRYVKPQGEPVRPSDIPVNQTQYGSAQIPPVAIDGTGIFVQLTGKTLRDFKYDYAEDAFNSRGLSSLAPHLLNDVQALAAWNGSSDDELNLVFIINGDGTMAVLSLHREAEVRAFVQWTTDGLYKDAAAVQTDLYFSVQRTINSVDYLFLEQASSSAYTDCAVMVTNAPEAATATGLAHLNGEACRVRADGFVLGDVTPSAGAATLAEGTFGAIEIGLNFNPTITPMPLNAMTPSGPDFMRKRRIVKVRVKVYQTLGLLVNGRPLADRSFDIDNYDEAATPLTTTHVIEETTNWDEKQDKLVTFTQVDPLPMEILAIDVVMESAG